MIRYTNGWNLKCSERRSVKERTIPTKTSQNLSKYILNAVMKGDMIGSSHRSEPPAHTQTNVNSLFLIQRTNWDIFLMVN